VATPFSWRRVISRSAGLPTGVAAGSRCGRLGGGGAQGGGAPTAVDCGANLRLLDPAALLSEPTAMTEEDQVSRGGVVPVVEQVGTAELQPRRSSA
jgi:hypothetical protein